ncbi:HAD family phosphatase [Collinsella tanakaei]|uniref:HAD-IIB family hydrolase n=1 Tax=Collinsella tanakaei TaxID=626935 RepID=UPI0019583F3D|nr:HAD family hydrolase [Collinsella tanakaei]MBM6755890.1 HAD family phosphatase [Collinsella tanakaei]
MANFDIIAFDLDGTIFAEPHKEIMSPRVERTLAAAHDAGVLTAVASGRPTGMLGSHVSSLPFVDWHITVNGACVSDARTGAIISERTLPRPLALDTIDFINRAANGARVGWSMFSGGTAYFDETLAKMFDRDHPAGESFSFVESALAEGNDVAVMTSARMLTETLVEGPDKLGASFETAEETQRVLDELVRSGAHDLEIAQVGPDEIEITRKGVGKGSALSILCEHLGIGERRAVAFGDSGNDATFADVPCTFVAMGNAGEHIKRIADDVCPSVREDGVAVWLDEHLGL